MQRDYHIIIEVVSFSDYKRVLSVPKSQKGNSGILKPEPKYDIISGLHD